MNISNYYYCPECHEFFSKRNTYKRVVSGYDIDYDDGVKRMIWRTHKKRYCKVCATEVKTPLETILLLDKRIINLEKEITKQFESSNITYEEALTELKASIEGVGFQCHIETYEKAIEALERQIRNADR